MIRLRGGPIKQTDVLTLRGADEIRAMFKKIPEDVQKQIEKGAMKESINELFSAVSASAPAQTGELRGSIKKSVRKRSKKGVVKGSVFSTAFYSRFIEYGFIHTSHGKKNAAGKVIKGSKKPTSRGHVPPNPFMRSAIARLAQSIVDKFVDSIRAGVEAAKK